MSSGSVSQRAQPMPRLLYYFSLPTKKMLLGLSLSAPQVLPSVSMLTAKMLRGSLSASKLLPVILPTSEMLPSNTLYTAKMLLEISLQAKSQLLQEYLRKLLSMKLTKKETRDFVQS
ncbi:hypothetical protein HF086_017946 [Spodoptera exigua]|uniref:Uncharacterized protein n=1 Tax=Spodoptera exigua TaxID=7107 RepID=A0A922M0D6_SPOEX|nr:hypothetical protein HF086_017946 [Spodoptera exigua]